MVEVRHIAPLDKIGSLVFSMVLNERKGFIAFGAGGQEYLLLARSEYMCNVLVFELIVTNM